MIRVIAVALLGAVATTAAVAWRAVNRSAEGTEQELAGRLERSGEPDHFEFSYRAGGTKVLDCFLPNREFSGAVDYLSGVVALRTGPPTGATVAIVTERSALLHRSLFRADAVPTAWVRVDRPPRADLRSALVRVLGADLGGYVLGDALPPTGRATALAALEVARDVTRVGRQTIGAAPAEGFRITVDTEEFAEKASPSTTAQGEDGDAAVPTFQVWMGRDNAIVRIEVQPQSTGRDGEDGGAGGWSVDYRPGRPLAKDEPSDVTALQALDLSGLTAASAASCQVPL